VAGALLNRKTLGGSADKSCPARPEARGRPPARTPTDPVVPASRFAATWRMLAPVSRPTPPDLGSASPARASNPSGFPLLVNRRRR